MDIQLHIPTDKGMKIVEADNIIRIEARSNYSKLFFKNERPLTVAKVLHWFEDRLQQNSFYRIHKTHIVNREYICNVSPAGNMLTLANGEQIKISRRRRLSILRLLA